jgi:CHAT domain-containing protein
LEPVISQEAPKRLIIVPDGELNLLPFDALCDSEGRYVLESRVVTYAPSATVLYLIRNHSSGDRATRNFVGVTLAIRTTKIALAVLVESASTSS